MNALQGIALWMGLVAVFGIFWALLKAGGGQEDDFDPPDPPASGA